MATEGTPLKRRRLNSTPDNAVHGQSRIVKRQRRRHADPNLLRTVLLRDRPTISQPSHGLCEFEFSESQICFGDVIETRDHAIIFRITANGRTFALKLVRLGPSMCSMLLCTNELPAAHVRPRRSI